MVPVCLIFLHRSHTATSSSYLSFLFKNYWLHRLIKTAAQTLNIPSLCPLLASAPYHKAGCHFYMFWISHFAPFAVCEFEVFLFSVSWLSTASNSPQLCHITEMCSWSFSYVVTSLPVKTPGWCVSTLELFSGVRALRYKAVFWHSVVVGTPGVPGTMWKARMLLCILKISPSFIMEHIFLGSDTYNPTLIFSDVLTRLTSHIKSKQPPYKRQQMIVSSNIRDKREKSHYYQKHNCFSKLPFSFALQ